jgi:hypothetical protein
MALTAWNRELGTTQGRIVPRGFVPAEGTFVWVLGCDLPGSIERLNIGDFVEVSQRADFGSAKLVRFRARMRPPAAAPAGAAWRVALRIDDVEQVAVMLVPGRVRDRVDLAANVSKLVGDHELAFRLELVAA